MSGDQDLLPPIPLFLAHAPRNARAAWGWLWQFDQRLVRLAAEPSEPMLAQIRLAWWRDQLTGAGKSAERRDPMLVDLDTLAPAVRKAVSDAAARLVDAVEVMRLGEDADRFEGAELRGRTLAGSLRTAMNDTETDKDAVGSYWGLAQLAPAASADRAWRARMDMLRDAASAMHVPRALSLMRLHGRLLERAGSEPLAGRAGLRLMAHALTGL